MSNQVKVQTVFHRYTLKAIQKIRAAGHPCREEGVCHLSTEEGERGDYVAWANEKYPGANLTDRDFVFTPRCQP
jgi:hypothetical protein